jgi:E3 ubiquitin-protein ligase UBR7
VKFLRPFAQDGKVVNESDVHGFFDSLKAAAAKKGRE